MVPAEILMLIFSNLDSYDLLECSLVCHFFRDVAFIESLWKKTYLKRWKQIPTDITEWRNSFAERRKKELNIPSRIQSMMFPQTNESAVYYFQENKELYETLVWWIGRLEGQTNLEFPIHHIATLWNARNLEKYLRCIDYSEKLSNLINGNHHLEDGAILLSEWYDRTSGDIIREQLDGLAEEFRVWAPPKGFVEGAPASTAITLLLEFITQYKNYRGSSDDYYNPNNSYFSTVLDSKQGIPISLSILFESVARRVGISGIRPMNTPNHFLLGYQEENNFCAIDTFTGVVLSLQELNQFLQQDYTLRDIPFGKAEDTWFRCLANLQRIYHSISHPRLSSIISFMLELSADVHTIVLRICLRKSENLISAALGDIRLLRSLGSVEEGTILRLEEYVMENTLSEVKRRKRNEEGEGKDMVRFQIGRVFLHQQYGYRGVIIGWDDQCTSSSEWINRMGVQNMDRGAAQPFYSVLVDPRDDHGETTYVAEDNIGPVYRKQLHIHCLGKYFSSYDSKIYTYTPNEYLSSFYPDL